MNCISDTEKFARRMFRICLVLAAGMALITLYWWILWDRIWLSPVDSIEEALYGRNVTGILAQLWLLPGISPAKLVSQTNADQLPVGHPCAGILDPVLAENYPGPGEKRASGFHQLLQPGRFLYNCVSDCI